MSTSTLTRRPSVRAFVSLAVCAAVSVGGLGLTAGEAAAGANSDRLLANEYLDAGQRLVSPDGQFVLTMQGDGNLVEYAPGNRAVWSSGTNRPGSILRMQGDGNVVIVAPGNQAVWATGTSGNQNATLELQNDGNVVVYGQGHQARWSTGAQTGGSGGVTDRIVSIARAEAANSGRNRESGTNCNYYSGALGAGSPCANGWRAQEWCADFARWVWGQAGARTAGLSGAAGSFAGYGTYRSGAAASNARVGDAVLFNYNGRGYASHVGIVTGVNSNGTITMISGNSSDMTRTETFTPSSRGVSGYATPRT